MEPSGGKEPDEPGPPLGQAEQHEGEQGEGEDDTGGGIEPGLAVVGVHCSASQRVGSEAMRLPLWSSTHTSPSRHIVAVMVPL